VREPLVDFGVLRVGDRSEAVFELENRGNAVLEILSADIGCDCMLAEYDETIAPGQVGRVRASLITEQLTGPVVKGIVLLTNDPQNKQVRLTLKAHVVSAVKLLPQPVVFVRERAGQPPTGRVLVRRESSEKDRLEISDLRPSVPWLEARAERLDAPRPRGGGLPDGRPGDWVIEIRFSGDTPLFGKRSATVSFGTGLTRQPRVLLEVESNLEAALRLSTSSLLLTRDTTGGLRGTLFASAREDLDVRDLVVQGEPSGLEIQVRPATERMVQVEVQWNTQKLEGGSLIFRLGNTTYRIPVVSSTP